MLSTSRRKRTTAPRLQADRALTAAETIQLVERWDAQRRNALADACHLIDRKEPTAPNWKIALLALERYGWALAVTERAAAERGTVATALAHAYLAQIGVDPDRAREALG